MPKTPPLRTLVRTLGLLCAAPLALPALDGVAPSLTTTTTWSTTTVGAVAGADPPAALTLDVLMDFLRYHNVQAASNGMATMIPLKAPQIINVPVLGVGIDGVQVIRLDAGPWSNAYITEMWLGRKLTLTGTPASDGTYTVNVNGLLFGVGPPAKPQVAQAINTQAGAGGVANSPISPYLTAEGTGMAVIAADTTYGRWQYRNPVAGSWTDVPPVSDSAFLILPHEVSGQGVPMRYVPRADVTVGGIRPTFRYRAWDGSTGSAFATYAPGGTIPVGGASAFSAEARDVEIQITPVNDTPLINAAPNGNFYLGSSIIGSAGAVARTATAVQILASLSGKASDPDGDALGLAISGPLSATDAIGWTYRIGGGSAVAIPPTGIPAGQGILLGPDDELTYTPPNGKQAGLWNSQMVIQAWDRSAGSAGYQSSLAGLASALSAGSTGLNYQVTSNTAPVPVRQFAGDLVVTPNSLLGVALVGSDDGSTDNLAWAIDTASGAGSAIMFDASGATAMMRFTADAGVGGSDATVRVRVEDGIGGVGYLDLPIRINAHPVIAPPGGPYQVAEGAAVEIQLTASDDAATAALDWSVDITSDYGASQLLQSSGASVSLRFTAGTGYTGNTAVQIKVADGQLGSAVVQVPFQIVSPNQAPTLRSAAPPAVAVAGQPWEALIAVDDADAGERAQLVATPSGLPSWIALDDGTPGDGVWRLHGTPQAGDLLTGTISFADPDAAQVQVVLAGSVVDGGAVAVNGPALSLSTPEAVRYGAIHPGTSSAIQQLGSEVASRGPGRARAFWWQASPGRFRELPSAPADAATAGIFLASLEPITVAFDAPPRPAPFAITLPAGSWSLVGIPPIQLDATTVALEHDWADFRLESADGVPVTSLAGLNAVLGRDGGTIDDTRPWTWSGTAYARSGRLATGTAYWVRNRTASAYRLVRAASGGQATFGTHGAIALMAARGGAIPVVRSSAAAPSAAELPPAPPAGPGTAPAQQAGSGSCGGGLAGMLLALGLLGLRLRRGRRD